MAGAGELEKEHYVFGGLLLFGGFSCFLPIYHLDKLVSWHEARLDKKEYEEREEARRHGRRP